MQLTVCLRPTKPMTTCIYVVLISRSMHEYGSWVELIRLYVPYLLRTVLQSHNHLCQLVSRCKQPRLKSSVCTTAESNILYQFSFNSPFAAHDLPAKGRQQQWSRCGCRLLWRLCSSCCSSNRVPRCRLILHSLTWRRVEWLADVHKLQMFYR